MRQLLTILLLGLTSCAHHVSPPTTFDDMSDHQKLLLFQRLPVDTPFEQVRTVVPGLEFSPRRRQWERDTDLFGRPAVVEVAVEDDKLRLWHYRIPWLDAAAGDSLFAATLDFYTSRFGEPHAEDANDVDYFVKYRGWCSDDMKLALNAFVWTGGTQTITIAIQRSCPHWLPESEVAPPLVPRYGE